MTRSTAIATMLSCIAAMTIGCGEGAGSAAALSGTALTVEIDELESFVDCDPPDNPNGGDFQISAGITDPTGFPPRTLDVFNDALVQARAELVEIDDLTATGGFRHEAGRTMYAAVSFREWEGGSIYDGQGARAHQYTWDDEKACWQSNLDDDCVAPGESRAFELDLIDNEGPSICEATLRYRLEFDRTTRSAATYAAGVWEGSGASLSVERGDSRSVTVWTCGPVLEGVFVNPDARDEIAGGGTCRAAWSPSGELDYEFLGRFVSDNDIRGTITFTGGGETRVIPVEGTRDLDRMRLQFRARDVAPIGTVTGPATWVGGATLEHVQ
jgi:hypothetical protein